MSKIKDQLAEAEGIDDLQLEKVLDEAADQINKKKPVKQNAKTKIMHEPKKMTMDELMKEFEPEEPVILSRVDVSAPKNEFEDFKKFVNATGSAIKKQDGTTYLKAEAWLYLAKLKGLTPSIDITPHRDVSTGKLQYVDAVCRLRDADGIEISKSAMMASKDEKFLKGLDDYAVYGMAETRAITRAVRNVYGYVAKGAGFESTPAIEMGLEEDGKD